MKWTSIPLAIAGTFALACADGTLPPRSVADPSNPRAPETPIAAEGPDAGPAASGPVEEAGPPGAGPHAAHQHDPSAAPRGPRSGGSP